MSWRFRKTFKVLPGVKLNLTRHVQHQRGTTGRLPKREHPRHGHMGSATHRRSFTTVRYSATRHRLFRHDSLSAAVNSCLAADTCHRNPQRKYGTAHQ